jgi:K+-sensing histidine kinase KdpD
VRKRKISPEKLNMAKKSPSNLPRDPLEILSELLECPAPESLQQAQDILQSVRGEVEKIKQKESRRQREEKTLLEAVRYNREELKRKIEEISLVRLVADAGIRSLLSENPLQFILDKVTHLTGADQGSIMLLDQEEGRLELAAWIGPDSIPPYERSFKLGEGIARWIDRPESTLSDSQNEDFFRAALKESDEKHGSILCYPLLMENRLIGVLSIGHEKPGAFSADTERVLYIIASQVALAVYSTHLVLQQQHQKADPSLKSDQRFRSLVERVNEILDINRLRTDPEGLEKRPIRIREILTPLRPKYKGELRREKIKMDVNMPKRIPSIHGDLEQLGQALEVLVETSLRRTPARGKIEVALSIETVQPDEEGELGKMPRGKKCLVVKVSDSAPTLESLPGEKEIERIRQKKDAPLSDEQRAGLSVYFARRIVEAHDGHLWLEPGPGERGNACYIALPVPE